MATTHHRLDGLEPDNLLAFLCLLGLLRSLDVARPEWRARAFWDERSQPLRPVLFLAEPATQDAIATVAAEGATSLAKAHHFDRNDLTYDPLDARKLLEEAGADLARAELLDSLMSDGAIREEKGQGVWPTPLCFLFGQGHQHFLSRLADIPAGRLPGRLAKVRKPLDLNSHSFIAAALFSFWTRDDATDGLRWDPLEDRRY
ncbi:MAG: hypothetical protein ACREFN_13065, partial [Acetobacteraceae bacterium]